MPWLGIPQVGWYFSASNIIKCALVGHFPSRVTCSSHDAYLWGQIGVQVGLPEPSHPIPKSGMSLSVVSFLLGCSCK
jgi:hypothetical protein